MSLSAHIYAHLIGLVRAQLKPSQLTTPGTLLPPSRAWGSHRCKHNEHVTYPMGNPEMPLASANSLAVVSGLCVAVQPIWLSSLMINDKKSQTRVPIDGGLWKGPARLLYSNSHLCGDMTMKRMLIAGALGVAGIALAACGEATEAEKAAEETKEVVEEVVEETEETAGDAMDAAEEAAGDAMDAADEAAGDAMDAVEGAADDAKDAVEGAADDAMDKVEEVVEDVEEAVDGDNGGR